MTSSAPDEAFVWIWLPGATEPVVAGRLDAIGNIIEFNYGRSYLERDDAIPIYLPELPLRSGAIAPPNELRMAGCIDDAGPDAWGQRVIMQHMLGAGSTDADPADLHPLTYLLGSGSDRIGALDFQESADDVHQPRGRQRAAGGVDAGRRPRRSAPALVTGVGSGAPARQLDRRRPAEGAAR